MAPGDLDPYRFDADWPTLVFVNGHFAEALSTPLDRMPEGVRVAPLAAALAGGPLTELVERHMGTVANAQDHAFTALNTALMTDGAVVHVGKEMVIDAPLHLLFVTDASAAVLLGLWWKERDVLGLPEDRIRYHTCYGINMGPRVHDMEMKDFIDIVLKIRAAAYSFEAANPRHEHEWKVWRDVKLPDDKLLIPGVIAHTTATVEHPETIATAIRIGNPASWDGAITAREESGGAIEAVTDDEILTAYRRLAAEEGIFCEPASAASVAGLLKRASEGAALGGLWDAAASTHLLLFTLERVTRSS